MQPSQPISASVLPVLQTQSIAIVILDGVEETMRYLFSASFVGAVLQILALQFFAASATHARPGALNSRGDAHNEAISVDESATRIDLNSRSATITLKLTNSTHAAISAHIKLELVSPKNELAATADRDTQLPAGATRVKIEIPASSESAFNSSASIGALLWYRLRYTITPADSSVATVTGIQSTGAAIPTLFELHVAAPPFVNPGGRYAARVQAVQPVTGLPVRGVSLQASLEVDSETGDSDLSRVATTNRRGFANLFFTMPQVSVDEDDTVDLSVTGKLGDFSASAYSSIPVSGAPRISLSTDKGLYQPGQTLHIRLMAFNDNHSATQNKSVEIRVNDPDDTLVFRTSVTTSRFGIASTDWQIPENLRLGSYTVLAIPPDGDANSAYDRTNVNITRYDLPTFSVSAAPDKTFYLPGQNAEVTVRANYLFGEAVAKGHVRVTREEEREWNFKLQKWACKERESYEADTDSRGQFVAKIDLSAKHASLHDADYERFEDLHYAAYFTDSSTGKTEQRRFDLRISKNPIHVYVFQSRQSTSSGEPLDFYVSTDYADGKPAKCDVDVSWFPNVGTQEKSRDLLAIQQPLMHLRTNQYGLAKVRSLKLPYTAKRTEIDLSLRAHDHKGAFGDHVESMELNEYPWIRVVTDKSLYAPGESVHLEITASAPDQIVFVEATHRGHVLASKELHLSGKSGEIEFLANDNFENYVSFQAYAFPPAVGDSYRNDDPPAGSRTVLFPKNRDLNLDVRLEKTTYRPGEQATANIRVTTLDSANSESALGLVVVDKSVEERQRSGEDFGRSGGFYDFISRFGNSDEIGGVRASDLEKLDMSKPVPDGLDLAAEALLLEVGAIRPNVFTSSENHPSPATLFEVALDAMMRPISDALKSRYSSAGEYPKTEKELRQELADAGLNFENYRDPWGTVFGAKHEVWLDHEELDIISAGPDKKFGTNDDFTVQAFTWPYFARYSELIRRAATEFHQRTQLYIRDLLTLRTELKRLAIDWDALRDPWGNPYSPTFEVARNQYMITIQSAGPDGRFATPEQPSWDDVTLAKIGLDYFSDSQTLMDGALQKYSQRTESFPQTFDEFEQAIAAAGIDWNSLRDPWGNPYYARFGRIYKYGDSVTTETYERHVRQQLAAKSVPVTQGIDTIHLWSPGEDGKEDTADDVLVASFTRLATTQTSEQKSPAATSGQEVFAGASGAISGTVFDSSNAVITGATITAISDATSDQYTATSDEFGKFVVRNLPAGLYAVRVQKDGFAGSSVSGVPVRSSTVTPFDIVLRLGATSLTVEVVSTKGAQLQTTNATVSGFASPNKLPVIAPTQIATPHLREYFPETLLWRPKIIADKNGRAAIKFPLADTITTWKLSAIASTIDGEIGTKDKEIRVFQPFFVEHAPPEFLTVGDEIALPVVLRNYLDHPLNVSVEMKSSPWFSLLSSSIIPTRVPASDSTKDIFHFPPHPRLKMARRKLTPQDPNSATPSPKKSLSALMAKRNPNLAANCSPITPPSILKFQRTRSPVPSPRA